MPPVESKSESRVYIYYIKYLRASEVEDTVRKSLSNIQPKTIIVADESKNALVIQATADAYRQIEPLIKEADQRRQQVMIELVVVKGTRSGMKELGIEFRKPEAPAGVGELQQEPQPYVKDAAKLRAGKDETLVQRLLESKQVEIVTAPMVMARDGEESEVVIGGEKLHYMEMVEPQLYKLVELDQKQCPGIRFTATPTIAEDSVTIEVAFDLVRIRGRAKIPEAPDLQVGVPLTGGISIATRVRVKDGEIALLGGKWGKGPEEPIELVLVKTVVVRK